MKSRIPFIAFCVAISIVTIFSAIIAYRLLFLPPCTPTKNFSCPVVDSWSIAGLAATVMGVAAAILALLGSFAVAAWWVNLDERVNKQVNDIFTKQLAPGVNQQVNALLHDQSVKVDAQVKTLQDTIAEASQKLQNFAQVQDATIQQIDAASKALLYLVTGNQLLEQKKIRAAIEVFQKAKQLQPDDAQVNYALGRAYRAIGSYDQAINSLTTAIVHEKDFPQAHFELGMAYRSRADKLYSDSQHKQQYDEDYNKAIEHLKEAVHLLPYDEEMIGTLGGTYRRYKKYQEALDCYKQALNINPDSSYALGNITLLLWHEGQLDDAREAFKRTGELATKRIDTKISYEPCWDYYDRGMARLALGKKEEALADYRLAAKLTYNPEYFKSVLSGIAFLKEVEDKYPLAGLNDALKIVEAAQAEAEKYVVIKSA